MLTFAFGFVVVGVCQMFLLVFCANILARKSLSTLTVVLVGIVLAVVGLILLAKIQYFSMVFVIVILIFIFRFKKNWLGYSDCITYFGNVSNDYERLSYHFYNEFAQ